MSDPDQTTTWRRLPNGDIRDRLAAYDAAFDDWPTVADSSPGLVSLGFIGSALRRGLRVWLTLTVVGLLVGVFLAKEQMPGPSATTTVLLDTSAGGQGQGGELATDAAIAQSIPVAAAVVAQLGLTQTPVSFLGTYTVIVGTTQILTITAKGPTDDAAVQRASAIATQFLAFRAKYWEQQLKQTVDSLNQQISQAQQHLDAIDKQISEVSAKSSNSSQQAELSGLKVQQTDASNTLASLKQDASGTQLQAQTTTAQIVHGSEVLSPATPGKRSVKKTLALYGIGGLVGGLMIGMAIVTIGAISSDRLRRRDDIAIAVGTPVRLSVGRLRSYRWLPDRRERSGRLDRDMDRVVEHLRNAVPVNLRGTAGLAVVAADDAPTVARVAVKLALTSSQQRRRVVLADLSAGAPAARRLGVTDPGISTVSPDGVPIVVVVPEVEEVAPVGPLRKPPPGSARVSEQLVETCAHADLLLSVVTLDPAFGGDHLGTWATDAVLVATAGRSTGTRLHAAGEMTRLAGVRLDSVVVLEANKGDESLGTVTADYQPPASARP